MSTTKRPSRAAKDLAGTVMAKIEGIGIGKEHVGHLRLDPRAYERSIPAATRSGQGAWAWAGLCASWRAAARSGERVERT